MRINTALTERLLDIACRDGPRRSHLITARHQLLSRPCGRSIVGLAMSGLDVGSARTKCRLSSKKLEPDVRPRPEGLLRASKLSVGSRPLPVGCAPSRSEVSFAFGWRGCANILDSASGFKNTAISRSASAYLQKKDGRLSADALLVRPRGSSTKWR